jgi:hypothetical protein
MQQKIEVLAPGPGAEADACDDLAAVVATMEEMRESLLDYNPLLAVMADGLRQAVQLELESRRLRVMDGARA